MNRKLIRIATVPVSLRILLKGQLRFMAENGFEVLCISSAGDDLEKVKLNEGVPVFAIEMSRIISPFRDMLALLKLYHLLRREKPLIVHTHTPKAGIIGMLGARLAGVPIRMHTIAGLPLMETVGLKRVLLIYIEKLTYRCATKVYPNSRGLYDFVLNAGLAKAEKLTIIGSGSSNGVCTNYFSLNALVKSDAKSLKQRLGIGVNDFVFIYVGRLVGDKGINELISAFSLIEIDTVSLILVGSSEDALDPLSAETKDKISRNSKIFSVGFVADVRPYFAISNALVFPSYREGFPNVVMQAGSMELPSIVSDINGCNEIIIEGKNGTIVPPKNVKLLYRAMLKMINNFEWYSELKSNSRELIVSRYKQEVYWRELLKEYNKLEGYVR